MCCCGKPTINGEPGYSWDGKTFSDYPVNAPTLQDGDTLIFDEPGRCGELDSHAYHLRIVKRFGSAYLLVRHHSGEECISLGKPSMILPTLELLDSNARYWLLMRLYHVQWESAAESRKAEANRWRAAAAEKRIKTRKLRGRDMVKVWIEDRTAVAH